MKNLFYISVLFFLMSCGSTTKTTSTTIKGNSRTTTVATDGPLNSQQIMQLKEEWEFEMITQKGEAPVIKKYDNEQRNKLLARKGAILDAQRKLAEKIGTIRLSSTSTMSDYSTSDVVQSRLNVFLKEVEVISEDYNPKTEMYSTVVQMPKVKLINIVEEYLID